MLVVTLYSTLLEGVAVNVVVLLCTSVVAGVTLERGFEEGMYTDGVVVLLGEGAKASVVVGLYTELSLVVVTLFSVE